MIQQAIGEVQEKVKRVAENAGQDPREIDLVLVTKTVESKRILEAYESGVRVFGENRVQELLSKKKELPSDIKWHMIGHLQTNKVKQVVGEVALIHSLDRIELAKEINKQAEMKNLEAIDCLIQVNASGEQSKSGLAVDAVEPFVEAIDDLRICVRGLMTIGPFTEDQKAVRDCFQKVKKLQFFLKEKFSDKGWNILSMGMSGDYPIAIEEGSTMIRVGSAIFGERNYDKAK